MALTPSSLRSSAVTTHARAALAAAFRRCCRSAGRFDGAPAGYSVRDRDQEGWRQKSRAEPDIRAAAAQAAMKIPATTKSPIGAIR